MKAQPSLNQLKLFDRIKVFTSGAITGFVSICYNKFGHDATSNAMLPIVLPFAEIYFNNCVQWIQNRDDKYLNDSFDAMVNIDLGVKSHPIDILNMIVPLTLTVLNSMDCSDVIGVNYDSSMNAVKVHVDAIIEQYRNTSAMFVGCVGHDHVKVPPGERVYTFETTNRKVCDE
jgi:hypothetical protein